jgi:hypothetical protein
MAFFSAGELLVLNRHDSIQALLERYGSDTGAIGINWLMFGSAGETAYRNELQAVRFCSCSPSTPSRALPGCAAPFPYGQGPHTARTLR